MTVWLGRGVDLRRHTPRRENKIRAPKVKSDPVDLTRKIPKKKRNTFYDQEDVTFAMLAGPHAIKALMQEGQQEIQKIYREMEQLYERHVPNFASNYRVSSFWDCDKSPVGLCVYDIVEDFHMDNCIFCGEPNERK